jgi:hypothetical protein
MLESKREAMIRLAKCVRSALFLCHVTEKELDQVRNPEADVFMVPFINHIEPSKIQKNARSEN